MGGNQSSVWGRAPEEKRAKSIGKTRRGNSTPFGSDGRDEQLKGGE